MRCYLLLRCAVEYRQRLSNRLCKSRCSPLKLTLNIIAIMFAFLQAPSSTASKNRTVIVTFCFNISIMHWLCTLAFVIPVLQTMSSHVLLCICLFSVMYMVVAFLSCVLSFSLMPAGELGCRAHFGLDYCCSSSVLPRCQFL
jgi:hypothetical protein